ncbi:MAG: hypothetical protein HYW86_01570 [Candidatus Roizmanbacteria bacterium]|nr:MAG: hypothetical protein HYW86_01570 [Candidatus Roizmanbacteria bacterium]
MKDNKVQQFIEKIKSLEKGEKLDLSSDEDLSIAVMNLISIEEHLFFSGGKTGKTKYFDLLHQIREMRKNLLKMLIKDYEGEVWCISKHLLAASMRLMEVATKAQTKGDNKKAEELFKKSYDLYNLFWGLNLGMVEKSEIKTVGNGLKPFLTNNETSADNVIDYGKNNFFGKISGTIGKILDCCKE